MSGPRKVDGRSGDPLDLFAVLAQDDPALGTEEDLAQVRRAVTVMRRGQRLVGRRSVGRRAAEGSAWLATLDWYRAAAVAVLSVGLVSLAASGWRQAQAPPLETAALETAAFDGGGESTPLDGAAFSAAAPTAPGVRVGMPGMLDVVPAVEDAGFIERPAVGNLLQPTTASVYELEGEDLDLVMVVHETLDV